MVKTVNNIVLLSPTHFVSNICHQYRCNQASWWYLKLRVFQQDHHSNRFSTTKKEKRKDGIKSIHRKYLDTLELYSFQICGCIFMVANIFVIWWVPMVLYHTLWSILYHTVCIVHEFFGPPRQESISCDDWLCLSTNSRCFLITFFQFYDGTIDRKNQWTSRIE